MNKIKILIDEGKYSIINEKLFIEFLSNPTKMTLFVVVLNTKGYCQKYCCRISVKYNVIDKIHLKNKDIRSFLEDTIIAEYRKILYSGNRRMLFSLNRLYLKNESYLYLKFLYQLSIEKEFSPRYLMLCSGLFCNEFLGWRSRLDEYRLIAVNDSTYKEVPYIKPEELNIYNSRAISIVEDILVDEERASKLLYSTIEPESNTLLMLKCITEYGTVLYKKIKRY